MSNRFTTIDTPSCMVEGGGVGDSLHVAGSAYIAGNVNIEGNGAYDALVVKGGNLNVVENLVVKGQSAGPSAIIKGGNLYVEAGVEVIGQGEGDALQLDHCGVCQCQQVMVEVCRVMEGWHVGGGCHVEGRMCLLICHPHTLPSEG